MFKIQRLAGLLAVSLAFALPALAQAPHSFPFRATNYDVEVILHPEDQNITATVKADFVAEQVSKTVVVELHPDLRIATVHEPNGKPLEFSRDTNSPLLVTIGLPEAATPGKKVTLQFDYAGPISSEDDSPTKGVRFANIDKTSAYLLLPARWFPLTNYHFEPLHRNVQVDRAGYFCGGGNREGRFARGAACARARGYGEIRIYISLRQTRASRIVCRGEPAAFTGADRGIEHFCLYSARASKHGEFVRDCALAHRFVFFRNIWRARGGAFLDHRAIAGWHAAGIRRRPDCF